MASFIKRRRTFKKKTSRVSVPRVRRIVMAMNEKKFKTFAWGTRALPNAIPASATPFSFLMLPAGTGGIIQGTAVDQRIGNKIFVTKIVYKFMFIALAGLDASGGSSCRFALYHNKRTNGALITGAQLFTNPGSIVASRAPNDQVLADVTREQMMSMVPTSATTSGPIYPVMGTIYPKKTLTYVSNGGTIADLIKDDYGFICWADAASCCEIYGEYTVFYTDA